jgi:TRAP transporter TAXI family solute receptor
LIAGVALALALVVAGPVAAQQKMNISWGGSTPGGMMYYLVGAAGTIITRELPQYNITQVSTGGSTENCKRLLKGEIDMGIVYGPHVFMALNNQGPFKNDPKGTMLRGVAKAYEGASYAVSLPDSGIKSMNDLVGKTVAMGPPGSGTVFNSTNVMRALGLFDKIKPRMMSFADAGRAVANKQIDAFFQSSQPAGSVTELAETKGAYVIPFTDEELGKIVNDYPFYYKGIIKEGTYKGVPETSVPFLTVYWVVHERVPEQAIYDITKLVFQDNIRKQLGDAHKGWKQIAPDTKRFTGLGAPMHPGAEKYYKEAGVWEK